MDGRNTMILPNADDIKQLTQKLKTQGDISLEEADKIYSLCRSNERYKILNPRSDKFDSELMAALKEWYKVVAKKIEASERGNFVFTVDTVYYFEFMQVAYNAIKKHGTFEDLCNKIMVNKKLHSTLSCKNLFRRTNSLEARGENYYEIESSQAGMLYHPVKTETGTCTILQFIKKLSPVISATSLKEDDSELLEATFEIAAGAIPLSQDLLPYFINNSSWVEKREIQAMVLGAFMKHRDISCVVTSDILGGNSVVFVEKDKAPLVKEALKIPFEDIIENALQKGTFNEEGKKRLLNKDCVVFPGLAFIDVSVQYIDDIVQTKMEWKAARNIIEEEPNWLEEVR